MRIVQHAVAAAAILTAAACANSENITGAGHRSFGAAHADAAAAVERPFGAKLVWNTDSIRMVAPSGDPLFAGRCSVPSWFIEFGHFSGEIMHAGLSVGTGSQCVQGTPSTGLSVTDAIDIFTTANGDKLTLAWAAPIFVGNGLFVVDGPFSVTGGTGRFEGASGEGTLHGQASATPQEVLAGAPVQAELTGTITYAPGRGGPHSSVP
jgi:hypothetical protein